jgi:hypothetical protein
MDPVRHVSALLATWRGRFILAFFAIQLLAPLHYYLVRRDPHDERYAWRMFSPMRMARCTPSMSVDGAPVQLFGKFHEAWVEVAQRGRFVVIEEMAAKLCEQNPGKPVAVTLDCTYLDRPAARYGGTNLCAHPTLERLPTTTAPSPSAHTTP